MSVSRSRIFTLFLLLLVLPELLQAATERGVKVGSSTDQKRIALVIGNGAYKTGRLKNPVNDANDISAKLKQQGFDTVQSVGKTYIEDRGKHRTIWRCE